MGARLIAFSIDRSGLVLAVAVLVVAWAGAVMTRIPVDVFPELNAPTVVVLTESGGLSAEEVEQRVTFPIESSMTGLPDVRRVRSASAMGLSLVWVEFGWDSDIYRARQLVAEKLASVAEGLPEGAHAEIGPVTSITGEIMLLSLSSPEKTVDDLELRSLAEFEVRPQLLAVTGVSQVVAIGGELAEYQVHVKQDDLLLAGLTLEDVVEAAGGAHSTRSAGYLANVGGQEQAIVQSAQVRSARDVRDTMVTTRGGAPVRLDAVASVDLGGAPRRGTAADRGVRAVVLSVQKAPGTNTMALTEDVDRALDQLEGALPAGVVLNRHAFRQTDFIQRSVDKVTSVLWDAVIIVSVVLLLFLLNLRTTLITLTALPLSIAAGLLALDALGLTINVMTLGGLAVAIGALVDDAIIGVENVYRRLGENGERPESERLPLVQVVFEATNEIRGSIVFATVIICVVFVPLMFLQGLEGRFFRPLALAYIVAVFASLAVALTVTPALCKHLLQSARPSAGGGNVVIRSLHALYGPLLGWVLRHRRIVLSGATILTGLALWLATTFGTSFLPEFSEGSFTVFLMARPGTSLDESDRLARGVERRLASLEGVRGVVRRTGRAERDEHAEPVWSSELDVTLLDGAEKVDVRKRINVVLEATVGITTMIGQPIEHRLSHILSGTPAAIAINFYGEDLEVLRRVAREAEVALGAVAGTRDVAANREALVTTLPVRYRHADLGRWGLTPAAAAEQVSAGFSGAVVDTVRDGPRVYDLVVRLHPDARKGRRDLENFVLHGRDGQIVRLSDVATVAPRDASVVVARENARRKAVVSCNIADGYNLSHVVEDVERAVSPIALRHGVAVEFGGQFEAERSARNTMMLYGGAVVLLVLMLLNVALGSLPAAGLVMVNLPLGLIGGIVAVFVADSPDLMSNVQALLGLSAGRYIAPVVSVASMVGLVTLFGIAIRNGILLVNHYATLQEVDGLPLADAVHRGSIERLVPILMTALTAVLGLVPLALAAGEPGTELLAPLATVVLGGLVTSTFLNLVVVPAGYLALFERRGFSRRQAERVVLTNAQ